MKNFPFGFQRIMPLTASLVAVCLLTISCANNPLITTANDSNSMSLHNLVHGKVVAKDSGKPIAGVTVYIPKTAALKEGQPIKDLSLHSAVENTMGCKLPREPYSSFACSDPFGDFTLSILADRLDNLALKIQYNDTEEQTTLSLNDLDSDLGTIVLDETSTGSQKKKVAIVFDTQGQASQMSNSFDNLSNTMKVEFEQQFSELYNIDENEFDLEFMPLPSLFKDKDADERLDIFNYTMVYLITPGNEDLSDLSKENKLTLLDYISNGGELFVTTLTVEAEEPSLEEYI